MTARLAFKNLFTKPWRSVMTIFAIALAVAVIFSILSFNPAVYNYVFSVQTAESGTSHQIRISYSGNGDKTLLTSAIDDYEEVEESVASLDFYWLYNGEYVAFRGFESEKWDKVQPLNLIDGSLSDMSSHSDDLIISSGAASHFNLSVGDGVSVKGSNGTNYVFPIAAIAADDGYFAAAEPFVFIGTARSLLRLPSGIEQDLFNVAYVKVRDGVDVDSFIKTLQSAPAFSALTVSKSVDYAKIKSQADNLSSTITVAGIAVVALAVVGIAVLFMMGARDKRVYVSKLTVVGATRLQIVKIFLLENMFLALVGAVLGSALGVGVFAALLKITLGSTATFAVSAWRVVVSALVGAFSAVLFSTLPLLKSFGKSVRDNALDAGKPSKFKFAVPLALTLLTAVCFIISRTVTPVKGVMSVVSLALLIACVLIDMPFVVRFVARLGVKSSSPEGTIASKSILRNKQATLATRLLTLGALVSMLLFATWSLTTNVFSGFVKQFDNLILVRDVSSSDEAELSAVDGVDAAISLTWKQGTLTIDSTPRSVSLIGTERAVDVLPFAYASDKAELLSRLNSDGEYVFVDKAYVELYSVSVGDKVMLTLDDGSAELIVGGILSTELFNGDYVVMSRSAIKSVFGLEPDTMLLTVEDGADVNAVVGTLRSEYVSSKNYYAFTALEAYSWDTSFLDGVFALLGSLAFVLCLMSVLTLVASTLASHASRSGERESLLNAGMSKSMLLRTEFTEHGIVAATSLICAYALSFVAFACLEGALRLFGLYFAVAWQAFLSNLWVIAIVGAVLALFYCLLPLLLGFKRGYSLRTKS